VERSVYILSCLSKGKCPEAQLINFHFFSASANYNYMKDTIPEKRYMFGGGDVIKQYSSTV